jgi:hypothetical protein
VHPAEMMMLPVPTRFLHDFHATHSNHILTIHTSLLHRDFLFFKHYSVKTAQAIDVLDESKVDISMANILQNFYVRLIKADAEKSVGLVQALEPC